MDGGLGGRRAALAIQRTLALAVAVFAMVLVPAGPAGAAVEKGLFLEESAALELSYDDLKKTPATVGVCNAGARPVTGLQAKLVGLDFKAGKDSPKASEVLEVTAPSPLDSGQCADITIKVAEVVPDPDAYSGSLLVTSAGAGAVRRPVSVSGPGYLPAGKLEGTRKTTPFTASHHPWPFQCAELKGDRLALRKTDATAAPAKLLKKDTFVGRIYKDGFSAKVRIAGKPSPVREGQFFVPIKIEGAKHVGKYSGSLDLTGDTKEADRIDITVAVKDGWGWAVLAIAIGVFIGLVPTLVRRVRIGDELCEDLEEVEAAYTKAAADFRRTSLPEGFELPDMATAVAAFKTKFEKTLKVYRDGAVTLDRKDKGYLKLKKMLAGAKKDAAVLGDRKGGLGPALAALHTQLDDLDSFLTDAGWSSHPPAFRKHAWPLLAGGELEVGGAIALEAKAKDTTTLITRWVALAKQVWEIEEWAEDLMAGIEEMDGADRERLADARAVAGEAHTSLRYVSKLSDIDRATAAATFRAHGSLTYLAQRYPTYTDALRFGEATERREHLRTLAQAEAEGDEPFEEESSEKLKQRGLPALDTPAGAVVEKGWRFVLDWGVIVLAVAVAVISSLSAFYFGKPWGTTADYVTVIFIGTGSQVVLKALTDSLTSLRESRTAAAEDDAEPAKAAATAA